MITIEQVKTLARSSLPLVTVVTGDNPGHYDQVKQAFLEQIAFNPSDLTYSYFDMAETPYAEVEMDLESLPFFADDKVVLVDGLVDVTTAKKSYLDDHSLKQLETYLNKPLETTRLVIFAPGKLDNKRRLVKLLKRDALVIEAGEIKEAEFRTYFQKEAHKAGLHFEAGVFEQLLIKSNFDFSQMVKNLAFLQDYKQQGLITEQDIAEAIPKTLADNIFELTQLLLRGQIDAVRDLVRDLRLQGQDEIKLIAVMLNQFRLLLQVKILAGQKRTEPQILAELGDITGRRPHPYQIKKALVDSRPLSLTFLQTCLQELILADYKIKTGQFDKAYLFDLALLTLASQKKC